RRAVGYSCCLSYYGLAFIRNRAGVLSGWLQPHAPRSSFSRLGIDAQDTRHVFLEHLGSPRVERHAECGGMPFLVVEEFPGNCVAAHPRAHCARPDVAVILRPVGGQWLRAWNRQPEPEQMTLTVGFVVILERRARVQRDVAVQKLHVTLLELHGVAEQL